MTNRMTQDKSERSGTRTPSVLLFVETSREFGRGLLHGIAKYARLHGPWRVYRWTGALDSSLPEWKSLQIDGAIVRDVKVVERLAHSGIPVIFVSTITDPAEQAEAATLGAAGFLSKPIDPAAVLAAVAAHA